MHVGRCRHRCRREVAPACRHRSRRLPSREPRNPRACRPALRHANNPLLRHGIHQALRRANQLVLRRANRPGVGAVGRELSVYLPQ